MTRKEAMRQTQQLQTLQALGFTETEAESLRRISMTLRRWHELECGTDHGCIVRGRKTREVLAGGSVKRGFEYAEDGDSGKPHFANYGGERPTYHAIPDRETGAKKRLASIIMRRNHEGHEVISGKLEAYIQGDPRGAALYILRPGDVPAGADAGSYYSRGICVY